MKNNKKCIPFLVSILFALLVNVNVFAQSPCGPPPPPPEGFTHGSKGNQSPAGAPIGGGLEILVALGLAYAGKKVYKIRQEEESKE